MGRGRSLRGTSHWFLLPRALSPVCPFFFPGEHRIVVGNPRHGIALTSPWCLPMRWYEKRRWKNTQTDCEKGGLEYFNYTCQYNVFILIVCWLHFYKYIHACFIILSGLWDFDLTCPRFTYESEINVTSRSAIVAEKIRKARVFFSPTFQEPMGDAAIFHEGLRYFIVILVPFGTRYLALSWRSSVTDTSSFCCRRGRWYCHVRGVDCYQ